jgi:acetoin:2,6-dichlorophenolindophenol oxidoreductase subunit beta
MTTCLQSLNAGLARAFDADPRVLMLGEDLVDPYGGAFKVSKGLSTRFPGRVISTPISEAGITGVAAGLAVRGLRPVVEIMFGDFLTLCTDQIVNHITKFALMYPGVSVPLVIRTPMGGGRGYGATHSQSLEKMFLGVPGLTVVSPSLAHDAGALLQHAVLHDDSPVLFIENKLLYGQPLVGAAGDCLSVKLLDGDPAYPTAVVRNLPASAPDLTVLAYGGTSRTLFNVMRRFAGEEISIQAVLPARLRDLPAASLAAIAAQVRAAPRVLIVEEGTAGFNWGSEMAALLYEQLLPVLKHPIRRLAADDALIPCAAAKEDAVLVTEDKIEATLLDMLS